MTRTYIYSGVAILSVVGAGAFFWMTTRPEFDTDLQRAFAHASAIHAYTQEDITSTEISERLLRIEGIYRNDSRTGRYASIATTTIRIPEEGEHSFSLENISLGDDVYTRVSTDSPLLKQQLAFDAAWHRFRRDAIPAEFVNVAISGPIMDHLTLFSDGGNRLDIVDGPIADAEDARMRVYSFRLAEDARSGAGGTLATLLERIGGGSIRIWIDEEDAIHRIAIDNGSFHSTTTLSRFNEPVPHEPPTIE